MKETIWLKGALSFSNSNCVEAAKNPDGTGVMLRHSRSPSGPCLRYTWAEWHAFVAGIIGHDFDGLLRD